MQNLRVMIGRLMNGYKKEYFFLLESMIEKLLEDPTMHGMTFNIYQVKQLDGLKKNFLKLVSD